MRISIALRNMYFAGQRDVLETGALNEMPVNALPTVEKVNQRGLINSPDSFNGITKRVSVRVKLIKTKPKETQ